ncbi:SLATT domain-containing protein [Longispora sp. K20-0274]|uniref:SLATT domain-containing protein n=1 Tax=Longispora sp. K20-0274 TaxID=3088255 RepID=UPI003999CEEA
MNKDLHLNDFPELTWTDGQARTNLDLLYSWGERSAQDAIDWYMRRKPKKARKSRFLRAASIVLATLGGAIPVASLAAARPELANWGFVLLALAAGCMGFDRFFGFSAAWARHLTAATALRGLLADYQLTWAEEMVTLAGGEPDQAETIRLIGVVRAFVSGVNDTMRAETENWLTEFHSRLAELETRVEQSHNRTPHTHT